jgi:hypothetical protein
VVKRQNTWLNKKEKRGKIHCPLKGKTDDLSIQGTVGPEFFHFLEMEAKKKRI